VRSAARPPPAPPDPDPDASTTVAAILPSSRSVQVGTTATAFAAVINTAEQTAAGCRIAPVTVLPASFVYQTTNPTTNDVTSTPNTPVDIAAQSLQTFLRIGNLRGVFAKAR